MTNPKKGNFGFKNIARNSSFSFRRVKILSVKDSLQIESLATEEEG